MRKYSDDFSNTVCHTKVKLIKKIPSHFKNGFIKKTNFEIDYVMSIDFIIDFDKKIYNFNCLYSYINQGLLGQERKLIIKSLDKDVGELELNYLTRLGDWWQREERSKIIIQEISNNFLITELQSKDLLDIVIRTFELENNRSYSKKLILDVFVEV